MVIPTILSDIVARKWEEVLERRRQVSEETLASITAAMPPGRGFADAIERQVAVGQPAIIAELKRASPSKGLIRDDFDAASIARDYEEHGATCLSVLTDHDFFQGSEEYLVAAREATSIPILRKEFIVDPYQVIESKAIGADCILLIAAILSDEQLGDLVELADEFGLDWLVEVHDREELARALALSPRLLGINNRDLHTFETAISTTVELLPLVPAGVTVVTESGIDSPQTVATLRSCDVHAFLVGEAMMRAPSPGEKLRELFF